MQRCLTCNINSAPPSSAGAWLTFMSVAPRHFITLGSDLKNIACRSSPGPGWSDISAGVQTWETAETDTWGTLAYLNNCSVIKRTLGSGYNAVLSVWEIVFDTQKIVIKDTKYRDELRITPTSIQLLNLRFFFCVGLKQKVEPKFNGIQRNSHVLNRCNAFFLWNKMTELFIWHFESNAFISVHNMRWLALAFSISMSRAATFHSPSWSFPQFPTHDRHAIFSTMQYDT